MSQLSRRTRRAISAARPLAWPVLVCTVVCALTPRPAFADPAVTGQPAPQPTAAAAAGSASGGPTFSIPDGGAAPVPSVPLPGASAAPGAAPPATTGPFASDILAKYADEELAGQQLSQANIDLAAAQSTTKTTYDVWQADLASINELQRKADGAAAKAYEDATGLGPLGGLANDVHQLGLLAPGFGDGSRGGPAGSQTAAQDAAAARARLAIDEPAYRAALAHEQQLAANQATLQATHDQLTADLANLQNSNALAQAQAQQAQIDQGLSARFLLGTNINGQGANPKAQAALHYALQRVDNPKITYLWGTEGPWVGADGSSHETYDCSGLVWAAYESTGYSWNRLTAADQFNQTRSQRVLSSQLLPGDLLFFSRNPNDWTQIYHVAIYAGSGQMVEAAYNGQPIDVATVHWSTFFAATRIYPSVAPVTPVNPQTPAGSTPSTPVPVPTQPAPSSTPPASTSPSPSPSPSPQTPPVPTGPPSNTTPPSSAPPSSAPPSSAPPSIPPPSSSAPSSGPPSDAPATDTTPTGPAPSAGSAPSGDASASATQSAASDPASQAATGDPSTAA